MNLTFHEFNPKKISELQLKPEISNFKITSLDALTYYTAEVASLTESKNSPITMRLLCNKEYCVHIIGANAKQ